MAEDAGRGWRYVVASPQPRRICDISLIAGLCARAPWSSRLAAAASRWCARDGSQRGVPAVIDKDLTTAAMADVLGIRDMMILTRVPGVALRYGQPDQQYLGRVALSEVRRYRAEGHFASGTMGPKVDAAIHFLEGGGRRAIITSLDDAVPALRGETGTHIVPDELMETGADSVPAERTTGAGA